MNDNLLSELEIVLRANDFTILDTSVIVAEHGGETTKYLQALRADQNTDIETTPVSKAIKHYQKIRELLDLSVGMVTEETLQEFERGNKYQENIANGTIRDQKNRRKKTKDIAKTILLEALKEETDKTEEALKQRQLFFLKPDLYATLFKFCKNIMPYSRSIIKLEREKMSPKKREYLFTDESITAAVLYFTITGENEDSTTVVSQDHDIKRELRLAHQLFMEASPQRYRTRAKRTPFKGYFATGQDELRYFSLIDSRKNKNIGSLEIERTRFGKEKVDELVVYAKETLDKVFSVNE